MKKIKEILKDIWRNYALAVIASILFTILALVYKSEMDIFWFLILIVIVTSPMIAILIYGIKEYFK